MPSRFWIRLQELGNYVVWREETEQLVSFSCIVARYVCTWAQCEKCIPAYYRGLLHITVPSHAYVGSLPYPLTVRTLTCKTNMLGIVSKLVLSS